MMAQEVEQIVHVAITYSPSVDGWRICEEYYRYFIPMNKTFADPITGTVITHYQSPKFDTLEQAKKAMDMLGVKDYKVRRWEP